MIEPRPHALPASPQATAWLLTAGGDSRLTVDPTTGANRYGCAPTPDPALLDFASSTASTISASGFAAADALRVRLDWAAAARPRGVIYGQELDRVRGELKNLCGLGVATDVEVVFAASGTDLHLLVRELIGGTPAQPLLCVGVEPEETGSGAPAALAGRHFSDRTALGETVAQGCELGPEGGRFVAVRARDANGGLRAGADIEAELDALALGASDEGRRMLLVAADVSKTGLISPSLDSMLALRRRFPRTVEVLIDACQFRLSPETLRAYLDHDLMVAVTGSKFLTGPVFSGALFAPRTAAERLRERLLSPALRAYSARADWPAGWLGAGALNPVANEGLLLRWEAALDELRAFRGLDNAAAADIAAAFAQAVTARISHDERLEPLEIRPLDRAAIGAPAGWDATATIFPFLLRKGPGGPLLTPAQTEAVYQALMSGEHGRPRVRLGQPVACGVRDGAPVRALRICNSARLMVEAARDPAPVIARALAALDRAAVIAERL